MLAVLRYATATVQLGLAASQSVAVTAVEGGNLSGGGEFVGDVVFRADNVATQLPDGLVVARVEVNGISRTLIPDHRCSGGQDVGVPLVGCAESVAFVHA